MLKFCNCSSTVDYIDSNSVNIYIDNLNLNQIDNGIISLTLDVTVVLEGIQVDQENDALYLSDIGRSEFTKLDVHHYVRLHYDQQQFSLDLQLNIPQGLYKLYYLRAQQKGHKLGQILHGKWNILGSSFALKVECLNENEVKFSSPSFNRHESVAQKPLKEITNIKVSDFKNGSEYLNSIEDEKHSIKIYHQSTKSKLK